jgi:hypothetical protein
MSRAINERQLAIAITKIKLTAALVLLVILVAWKVAP